MSFEPAKRATISLRVTTSPTRSRRVLAAIRSRLEYSSVQSEGMNQGTEVLQVFLNISTPPHASLDCQPPMQFIQLPLNNVVGLHS